MIRAIEDEAHGKPGTSFATREAALAELRRLAALPWDEPPNQAPCPSWRTCGRHWEVVEYDDGRVPWRERLRAAMLEVSAQGILWQR